MNAYLDSMLSSGSMITRDGSKFPLHSTIDRARVELLQRNILGAKATRVIEVGCAMGMSSVAIQDALHQSGAKSFRHTIIDPGQFTDWQGFGVQNLRQAGFDQYELITRGSEYVLPELAASGAKFDLGLIDGWHTFDHTLIDFFYINRMLSPGGLIAIDDVHLTGINQVVRFVTNYPCYVPHDFSAPRTPTWQRRLLNGFRRVARTVVGVGGKRLREEILSSECSRPDVDLLLHGSMIVLRKIDEDNRPWNWHERI